MKSVFGCLVALLYTTSLYAATTPLIRTAQGDIVSVGDSKGDLFKKMGKAPATHTRMRNNGKTCAVSRYHYQIDQQAYEVSVCQNQIVQIDWMNN